MSDGAIDFHDNRRVMGWTAERGRATGAPVVDIVENGRLLARLTPSLFRWDLYEKGFGEGPHGFSFPVDDRMLDGQRHELHFQTDGGARELKGSPVVIERLAEAEFAVFHLARLPGSRVLVIAPHPDDESLACGGALALHRDRGDAVKTVFLTDGECANPDADCPPAEYARRRRREAEAAARILGIGDIEFWAFPDRRTLAAASEIESRMAATLRSYGPDVVYCPSPHEFHPDHRTAAEALWRAVQAVDGAPRIAFFDFNRPVAVNTLIDISNVLERKRSACDAYSSQTLLHPYTEAAIGLNRYRALTVSSQAEYAEGYFVVEAAVARANGVGHFTRMQWLPPVVEAVPLVSVVIRTRNRRESLLDAVSSVALQTWPNVEAVVVNDGGDDVESVLAQFRDYLPVHLIELSTSGRSAAANAGVAAAKGKYCCLLDDDDVLYRGHIAKLASFLEATGRLMAYSDCETGEYEFVNGRRSLRAPKSLYMGLDYDADRLQLGNFIPVMTAIFERKLWAECGGMDPALSIYEDWDLWLRMSRAVEPVRLPGVTAEYRIFTETRPRPPAHTAEIHGRNAGYWVAAETAVRLSKRLDDAQSEGRRLRLEALALRALVSALAPRHSAGLLARAWRRLVSVAKP